jgi:hypothetical protein
MKKTKKMLIGFLIGMAIFDIINIIFCAKFGECIELTYKNTNNVIIYYLISGIIASLLIAFNKKIEEIEKMKIAGYKKAIKIIILEIIILLPFIILSEITWNKIDTSIIIVEYMFFILTFIIIDFIKFVINKQNVSKINNKLKQIRKEN